MPSSVCFNIAMTYYVTSMSQVSHNKMEFDVVKDWGGGGGSTILKKVICICVAYVGIAL